MRTSRGGDLPGETRTGGSFVTEHFPRSTVSQSLWCNKCQKHTQHRIDDGRKGPCLVCIEKLEAQHEKSELPKVATEKQEDLFQ